MVITMCGFVGFVDKMEQAEKCKVVKGMADLIIHRGPDQDDYFVDDDMALGFRRLSIIDSRYIMRIKPRYWSTTVKFTIIRHCVKI